MGQKVFFRVSTLNTFVFPLVAVCDIPVLTVRVKRVVVPFRVKEILISGKTSSMTLVAKCIRAGTFRVTAFVLFINPFTGRVLEVADTALVLCDAKGTSGGAKDGSTDTTGGQTDGSIGELGGDGA
jgi:hypothetical protein